MQALEHPMDLGIGDDPAMRVFTPIPIRVAEFLQDERLAFCDPCIKDRLGLASLNQAQRATSALALRPGFDRRAGICTRCAQARKVIRVKVGQPVRVDHGTLR